MYVHIGENKVLRKKDILFIMDLDSSTVSVHTRNFLKISEAEKRVTMLGFDLPKSFVVTRDNRVYLSPFNSVTIKGFY